MADVNVETAGAANPIESPESKVEPSLPKLSPAEHRMYNHMAENMDYFVRKVSQDSRKVHMLSRIQAQPLPEYMESHVRGLLERQTAGGHVNKAVHRRVRAILSPSNHASHYRRDAYFSSMAPS